MAQNLGDDALADAVNYLETDANGLPIGHREAFHDAAKELRDVINELPDSVYHLGPTDAEWACDRMLHWYLVTLMNVQRVRIGTAPRPADTGE